MQIYEKFLCRKDAKGKWRILGWEQTTDKEEIATLEIINQEQDVLILGIESSCDETAASVVRNGREVLSNVISSQIDIHTLYGGVVPEIASRKHIERINYVIEDALKQAKVTLEDITAVSVTYGPGLVEHFW